MATLETQYKQYLFSKLGSPDSELLSFEDWQVKLGEDLKKGIENIIPITASEFNLKYSKYLEEGHYGLDIDIPSVVSYLDGVFVILTKAEDFKYSQIKLKYDRSRFYVTGHNIKAQDVTLVETYINYLVAKHDLSIEKEALKQLRMKVLNFYIEHNSNEYCYLAEYKQYFNIVG